MGPPSLRRRLPALVLVGSLVLPSAVAHALPFDAEPHRTVAVREQGRGLFNWLGQTFVRLWAETSGDNGQLIDPDGRPSRSSADGDNGQLIDPDG